MNLAKDALDVGLLTDDPERIAFFEKEVGLGAPLGWARHSPTPGG